MFLPLFDPPDEPGDGPAVVVAVHASGAVLLVDVEEHPPAPGGTFVGVLAGRHVWAIDAGDDDPSSFRDLRLLWGSVDELTWTVAGRAVQLVEWSRTHRFCGRCGERTAPTETPGERAMGCPSCGLLAFPRLAPAVITLIERDDGRVLLARNKAFGAPMYSLLAGFVEPGETLEQAVARETLEEVGVRVDDITYWSSQPWPFPHSLMIGFLAHYTGGELTLQESEIADAGWFAPDELPMVPPRLSIAGRMIEDWVARRAGR